jgi:cytochrome b561
MTNQALARLRYDRTTIALHWAVAVGVAVQWISGQTIDWWPRGPLKVDARSAHIVMGATLAGLLLWRLYWRAFRGERLPRAEGGVLGLLAVAVHWALLAGLAVLLGLGLYCAWLRGDSLFGLVRIPVLGDFAAKARHQLVEQVTNLHGLGANLILWLASFHAAAALAHHFYWKDGVLKRML